MLYDKYVYTYGTFGSREATCRELLLHTHLQLPATKSETEHASCASGAFCDWLMICVAFANTHIYPTNSSLCDFVYDLYLDAYAHMLHTYKQTFAVSRIGSDSGERHETRHDTDDRQRSYCLLFLREHILNTVIYTLCVCIYIFNNSVRNPCECNLTVRSNGAKPTRPMTGFALCPFDRYDAVSIQNSTHRECLNCLGLVVAPLINTPSLSCALSYFH